VRGACSTCGHGIWLLQSTEPGNCGRCRAGLAPAPRREAAPAADQAASKACPICFEAGKPEVQYATITNESWENNADRCGAHGICAPCLQQYVEVKVLDEGLWNLRCPGERCRYQLVEEDITKALRESSKREAALERHANLRKESFAPRLEEMLAAQATKKADGSKALDETEQLLLAECQVCPRCSVLVRREGGCKHIVCRCSQDFCFGCGAPFDEEVEDFHCICEEDGSVDDMDGEGRPCLGLWLQRKKAKEVPPAEKLQPLAPDPETVASQEQDTSTASDEDIAVPASSPEPSGSAQAPSIVLVASPEAPPIKAPLLLRASSVPQGKPNGLLRRSRSQPLRRARPLEK